ncbi:MAG: ATP-binding protein [Candidatus Bathyarchaeia archaeon]|jgi:hypothetical protein
MSTTWKIGVRQLSTVSDWKKLIRDFRDQFPYDPLTALIVETFANAVDAGATKIEIELIGDNVYRIKDNGSGMSQAVFKEYHNIASLTKKRGETIGFAGVGAKIFLDRAESIVTETKSKSFKGATHWAFYGDSLEWKPIHMAGRVKTPVGTFVQVGLKTEEDKSKLTPRFVAEVLQQQYNAILMGYYAVKNVEVNGKRILPWKVPKSEIEQKKELLFKYGKNRIKGFIVKSTKSLPEDYQGPFIVVHGKTVNQEWFRQYPLRSDTFYGLIQADFLIAILRTSKSDFERTSMIWKKFCGKMASVLSQWLDDIGAKPTRGITENDLTKMSEEIEKSINKVLKMPEFKSIANTLFQNIIQQNVAVKNAQSELMGEETNGAQRTAGTTGGQGGGEGTTTMGDEEGSGFVENPDGTVPIEKAQRRVRGLVKLGFEEKPDDVLEGWADPAQKAIIINIGHPAWKIADELTLQSKSEHVRVYHVLRTVFSTLVDEVATETPKETLTKLFSSWYDSCIKGQ